MVQTRLGGAHATLITTYLTLLAELARDAHWPAGPLPFPAIVAVRIVRVDELVPGVVGVLRV